MQMQAISAELFAQQNIETTPQIRSQTKNDDYEFSIVRAYSLLMAVLVIPLYLTLFMLNFSAYGLI